MSTDTYHELKSWEWFRLLLLEVIPNQSDGTTQKTLTRGVSQSTIKKKGISNASKYPYAEWMWIPYAKSIAPDKLEHTGTFR